MRLLPIISCLLAVGSNALIGRDRPKFQASAPVVERAEVNAAVDDPAYWLKDMPKQGLASFNNNPAGYKVWRNVKDYGAKGDGVTDDSAAINQAILDQSRCGPWVCDSNTDTPAVVYFPAGTYIISKSIIVYYNTQLIGNPNGRAILKAAPSYTGIGVIDGSPYNNQNGAPGWTSTNLFMRQIRNLEIDLTAVPPTQDARGIHWPASQATSIQNVKIRMTPGANSVHEGIFIENGSGGWLVDIEIEGGKYGMNIGNQQFTMRNLKISRSQIGIRQIWNWGWLYQGLTISDCPVAFSMLGRDKGLLLVGSAVIIDSRITNCPVFLDMEWSPTEKPTGASQVILENIALTNVPVAVRGYNNVVLPGGTTTIAAWGQGTKYTPDGPQKFQGAFTPAKRPAGLLDGNNFYSKQKPQFEELSRDNFLSARALGAKGDGRTNDQPALQNAINTAVSTNKILYIDHGNYRIESTLYFPPGTRVVGEAFPVILAAGGTWSNKANPVPVIQIGKSGEKGLIQWTDMIVATQGPTPGATLIEYNLDSVRGSGVWDVHTRIGGAKGTQLQVAQCPTMTQKDECMAAYMNVHVTKTGNGAYFENNWFWTADHDLDDRTSTRVSVFTGRGLLVESSNVFLYSSGVEHHAVYQYQFANARNIFAGFIQTETPYWQPNPDAKSSPYPFSAALNDPDYASACPAGQICDAYGLRILNSQGIFIYGAGLYSFFKNYDVSCSSPDAPNGLRDCQNRIFSIEGSTAGVNIYALSQVGALQMVTIDGVDKARWSDNLSVYSNTIGLFTYKT